MKIALGIEYDGSQYSGWQRQPNQITVQGRVEDALSRIANETIQLHCAGRTDAGVHGTGQVVHFDTNADRDNAAWTFGVNSNLPKDIAVRWAMEIGDDFHARFSATARRYRYIICNQRIRPGILFHGVSHYYEHLDESLMHEAAQALVGEHDFTSFRATYCQANSPFRNIISIEVIRRNQYVIVDVKANAFLHHMVRNIVGSLIEVGTKEQEPAWMKTALLAKDRSAAGPTAKPHGLYMVEVDYPEQWGLPRPEIGPLFI